MSRRPHEIPRNHPQHGEHGEHRTAEAQADNPPEPDGADEPADEPAPLEPSAEPATAALGSQPISVLIPGDAKPLMMVPQAESPLLGKLVLFTPANDGETQNGAKEYVGVIGQVLEHTDGSPPYCNLLVMPPFIGPRWEGSVLEGEGPRTWRWPATGVL